MLFAIGFLELLQFILPKLLVAIGGIAVGWLWGHWRASKEWERKDFRSSLVLSLNAITPHESPKDETFVASLRLRTLFERPLEEVITHRVMRDKFEAAMAGTTSGESILRFAKEDAWYILNTILNQIAEQFADGAVRDDMGLKVDKRWFMFCVTFENEGRMHQFKPRALLMDREKFLAFPDEGAIELESSHHEVRVATLRALKKEYKANPHLFMALELSM